jgi:hypothetical protein
VSPGRNRPRSNHTTHDGGFIRAGFGTSWLFPRNPTKISATRCNADEIMALSSQHDNERRSVMPFLIPVLIGIPVLFGGGFVVYHLVH